MLVYLRRSWRFASRLAHLQEPKTLFRESETAKLSRSIVATSEMVRIRRNQSINHFSFRYELRLSDGRYGPVSGRHCRSRLKRAGSAKSRFYESNFPFAKHCPDSALDFSDGSFSVCEITMKIDQACRFHCLGNKDSRLAHTGYRLSAPNSK
jgi:hypothetical protein